MANLKSIWTCAVLAALGVVPPAGASTLKYELGTVHTGGTPTGAAPWLVATFTTFDTDRVLLTIESTHWTNPGQFVDIIGFNHNLPAPLTVSACTTALCGGTAYGSAPAPSFPAPAKIAPGGTFDLAFDYPQAASGDRFTSLEEANFLLEGPGLNVINFDDFSAPTGRNPAFKSYAHIQGFGDSSKIYDNTPEYCADCGPAGAAVPEPGMGLLLASGLAAVGLWSRRRRR
jgi:hypothetical protein